MGVRGREGEREREGGRERESRERPSVKQNLERRTLSGEEKDRINIIHPRATDMCGRRA
jgi:hypothetical protein